MKRAFTVISLLLLSACAGQNVPDGEMERMRASMPREQSPPASYNSKGIGVP